MLFPSHSAPPAKGAGSEQSRDRERLQSTPQEDQELQSVHPPARGVFALNKVGHFISETGTGGQKDSLSGSVERVEGDVVSVAATGGVLVAVTDLVTVLLLVLVSRHLPAVTIIPTTTTSINK